MRPYRMRRENISITTYQVRKTYSFKKFCNNETQILVEVNLVTINKLVSLNLTVCCSLFLLRQFEVILVIETATSS